jgi:hypothetical protein
VRTQRGADCVTIQVGLPPARRERITWPLSVAEMPPPGATPAQAGEPVQTRTGRARLAGDARDGVMIRVDDGPLAVSSENSS